MCSPPPPLGPWPGPCFLQAHKSMPDDSCNKEDIHAIFDATYGHNVVADVLAAVSPESAFRYLQGLEEDRDRIEQHHALAEPQADPECFIQESDFAISNGPVQCADVWEARRVCRPLGMLSVADAAVARVLDEVLLKRAVLVADVLGVFAVHWEALQVCGAPLRPCPCMRAGEGQSAQP